MPFDSLPEKLPQVVIDLMAARHYLDTHGWCKHAWTKGTQRCAVGAVWEIIGVLDVLKRPNKEMKVRGTQAELALTNAINTTRKKRRAINPTHKNPVETISGWNDIKSRTYLDVQIIFDKAITAELEKARFTV